MTTDAQLTDDQLETLITYARNGDENAQFLYQQLKRRDLTREQVLRVEKMLEEKSNA